MLGFGFNGWVFALNFDFGFWGWEILNFWALELGFDVKRNWCCQKVFFFFFFFVVPGTSCYIDIPGIF